MRLKLGSRINFFNKDGEWEGEITFIQKDKVEVKFIKKIKEANNSSKIELAICLVKKTPMENILQKSTELGVSKIIPIVSERTEVKDLNYERAKKIVIEATEQSNQLNPPEISEIKKLKDFLKNLDSSSKLLFADVNSQNILKDDNIKKGPLSVLIGPEGDFSPAERESILKVPNVKSFTISKNILRSDTAVITAISLVNFVYFNS
jgi:RNA methyltransferase, RsmE family